MKPYHLFDGRGKYLGGHWTQDEVAAWLAGHPNLDWKLYVTGDEDLVHLRSAEIVIESKSTDSIEY